LQLGSRLRFFREKLSFSAQFYNVLNQRYYSPDPTIHAVAGAVADGGARLQLLRAAFVPPLSAASALARNRRVAGLN